MLSHIDIRFNTAYRQISNALIQLFYYIPNMFLFLRKLYRPAVPKKHISTIDQKSYFQMVYLLQFSSFLEELPRNPQ
jgi:hypothetical protein